ncbi:flagellar assembly protein FliH [uncultured Treponema sp.]|uniref:flagellar assembly protein FliH n=1 Tax=uncultured Treponema sp. TaxID=162155 RepID=UPI000E9EB920|nr:flagellar assembly protein FliH [uncultured Treponema sp.]HAZ95906.1 flagellar assembly protein FliH [Treponema sp.]
MAQTVFRPAEVNNTKGEVVLQFTKNFAPPVEEKVEKVPEYTGPTADDLRKEAEAFKLQWEDEKAKMLAKAQADADQIVKNAEDAAFAQVKHQSDQAAVIKSQAQKEAQDIVEKAKAEAQDIISNAKIEEKSIFEKSKSDGFKAGHEEGYKAGNEEAQRLVERIHKMIEAVQAKRQEILDNTEQQIVNLVILIVRKVVKIMSENQKSVIMSNVLQALKKVKGSGDVTLRVNLADVKLTTEHIKDFIRQVENIKNISVVEDSSVEKGGCIVETDFGAIDARISSQLNELETQILNISPIKTVGKSEVINPDS